MSKLETLADSLIILIKNSTLSVEFVRNWAETRHESGFLDNLLYLEIIDALEEYEKSNIK